MKKVSIIGFGRFGKTLLRLLKDDFEIRLFDANKSAFENLPSIERRLIASDLTEVYESEVIFYAVPISSFEDVIKSHKKYLKDEHLLIDVLSVKVHPKNVFEKQLKGLKTRAILTHPMFGPDSSKEGFIDLPIVINKFSCTSKEYTFWKKYLQSKKLRVVEMTAHEHDRVAANSQGLTHFLGRLLNRYGLKNTNIDTLGSRRLLEVVEQTCNDSWQLFNNLQTFNSYTKAMRIKFGNIYDNLYNKLLPKNANPGQITFGIQGGKGSFNEEAIVHYIDYKNIKNTKVLYLYTSENVLKALHEGDIDMGQFAIHNSIGGIVKESIDAMAKYKIRIVKEFAIKISHALMIRNDAKLSDIDTIMTHPQVLAQCKSTLSLKYPDLKLVSGKGKLIDHALVAKKLSEKKLPKNIAVMGSKVLSQIYDLKLIEENLQDAKENYTSFLVVERI